MATENHYDVIVIGGGSAGTVVATRLSEDPARRVLLLEAGPDPQPVPEAIADGKQQVRAVLESPYVLLYPTERWDGSELNKVSGRIMGGGASVNAMAVVRPTKHDLDSWAARGNPGWTYDECLPLLKRLESDQDYGDDPIHGTDGPLYVKRPFRLDMEADEPVQAFMDRAQAMGMPLCPDLNVAEPFGVCGSAYNIKDQKRFGVTAAYLDPARSRANLDIQDESLVTGLNISEGRVTGVTCVRNGETHTISATRVVVSAGAYHSPQILTLSGIGPEAELQRLGIPTVQALAGVGENYQDHATVEMTYSSNEEFDPDWVIPRFRLMYKSDRSLPTGNFHIFQRPPIKVEGLAPMWPVSANLLEQRQRGRLYLNSADPEELPIVEDAMLRHPDDIKAMLTAMEFIDELVSHPSMAKFYGPRLTPAEDEDWAEYARSTHGSYHHGAGTCMMGPASDPMAVVDHRLHVHGIENLYVADASVMPTVTHANTNVATIMIGERCADIVREDEG